MMTLHQSIIVILDDVAFNCEQVYQSEALLLGTLLEQMIVVKILVQIYNFTYKRQGWLGLVDHGRWGGGMHVKV